jgi:LysM repeat protein
VRYLTNDRHLLGIILTIPSNAELMLEGLMKLHKIIWQLSSAGILLVTVCCLFFGCSQKDLSDEIKSIKDKLAQIEKRLAEYEQQKEVKELRVKLDEGKAALEEELKKIEEQYEKKPEKIEKAKASSQEKPVSQKKPNAVAKQQYHTVSHGETLYSISRKYKVSVAELCRLNNLKPTQHVQTGQKLLISNGSKR